MNKQGRLKLCNQGSAGTAQIVLAVSFTEHVLNREEIALAWVTGNYATKTKGPNPASTDSTNGSDKTSVTKLPVLFIEHFL